MKKKNTAAIGLVVLGSSFFLLCATGCSGMKTIWNWPKSFFEAPQTNPKDPEVTQFLSTVRPYPGNPDSHYLLACYYQERGRHEQAIAELQKVLLIDPLFVKAHNGLGISYDHLGDFPKAVESYEKALKLNPVLDYVQNNLGYSLFLQGNLDGAIAAFQKAIGLNEREPRFHNNLGLAYAEKGQMDLAMGEFRLAGDEAKASFNIAQFLHKRELNPLAKMNLSPALPPTSTRTGEGNSTAGSMADSRKKSLQQNGERDDEDPQPIQETTLLASFPGPEKATLKAGTEPSSSRASEMASPREPLGSLAPEFREIPAFLATWKRSWERKDLGQYMGCYSKKFHSQGKGWKQWRQYKKNLNECYDQIRVSLKDVKIRGTNGQTMVSFRQSYRSDGLKSVGQKSLALRMEGNSWKIIRESFHRSIEKRTDVPKRRV